METTPKSTEDIKALCIRDAEELERWKVQWNDLLNKSDSKSLFLSFNWLLTWWKCHKDDRKKLCVYLFFDQNILVGVAPLMIKIHKLFWIRWNSIEFLSMMDHAYSPTNCSGMLDLIYLPAYSSIIVNRLFTELKSDHRWYYLRLHPLLETSQTINLMKNISERERYYFNSSRVFSGAQINANCSWDDYLKSLGNQLHDHFIKTEKKLSKQGNIEITEITSSTEIESWYSELLNIEKKSWKWTKGIRINEKVFKNFYKEIINKNAQDETLHLWFLKFDSVGIAYNLGISYEKFFVGLKSSYDHQFHKFSPGNILTYQVFKNCFDTGIEKIDLLWGNIQSKSLWTANYLNYNEIFIFNNKLISKLLFHFYHTLHLYNLHRLIQRRLYFYTRQLRSKFENLCF